MRARDNEIDREIGENMLDFTDICMRTEEGQMMQNMDFYMKCFIPKLGEVLKKYDVKYDPDTPVPSDDALADRVFEAALEFFVDVGIYVPTTSRNVKFTRNEVEEAMRAVQGEVWFGEGTERKVMKMRRPDDGNLPWFHLSGGVHASSEQIFLNLVEAFARIPGCDSVGVPSLVKIRGKSYRVKSPLELLACIRTVELAHQGLRRAGKPGMPILNNISTSTHAASTIAACNPDFGLRPSDGFYVDSLSEFIVDFETLNKAAFYNRWGAHICSVSTPLLGGYGGGPEGTAVLGTAYMFIGPLVFKGEYNLNAALHFKHKVSTTRAMLWVDAVINQATTRNTRYPNLNLGYLASGGGTDMYYHETAAFLLSIIPSGGHVEATHASKAVVTDSVLPIEMAFNVEIGRVAAEMTRKDALPLVKHLLEKYENRLKNPPKGYVYPEAYDIESGKPKDQEYLKIVKNTKKELREMGLPIEDIVSH